MKKRFLKDDETSCGTELTPPDKLFKRARKDFEEFADEQGRSEIAKTGSEILSIIAAAPISVQKRKLEIKPFKIFPNGIPKGDVGSAVRTISKRRKPSTPIILEALKTPSPSPERQYESPVALAIRFLESGDAEEFSPNVREVDIVEDFIVKMQNQESDDEMSGMLDTVQQLWTDLKKRIFDLEDEVRTEEDEDERLLLLNTHHLITEGFRQASLQTEQGVLNSLITFFGNAAGDTVEPEPEFAPVDAEALRALLEGPDLPEPFDADGYRTPPPPITPPAVPDDLFDFSPARISPIRVRG